MIELNGIYHVFKVEYDYRRQKRLETFGIKTIQFEEKRVLEDIDPVLNEIEYWVEKREKLIYE